MPQHDREDDDLRSPKRLREWVLLAATIITLLSNVGMHLVFSGSSTNATQLMQLQTEMSDRLKADAEIHVVLNAMHEHEALLEMRIKYLEERK